MTATRIYRVFDTDSAEDAIGASRLVRAASAAQAIRHCADHYRAHVATQDDIAELVGADVQVETAGAQQAYALA